MMKKNLLILVVFILGISIGLGINNFLPNLDFALQSGSAQADDLNLDEQEATVRAIQKVMPAVVNVLVYDDKEVVNIDLEDGEETSTRERYQVGTGSGFLISKNGLILTNKHVVEASGRRISQLEVVLNNGQKYDANLIDKDSVNDLAVLQIAGDNFPYVELGNSDDLPIGTTVIAIGNALGRYQNSATKGIISGLGRSLEASGNKGYRETLVNVIQTDAEINHGNSGGPLINLSGEVIGVNVAMDKGGSSIGFTIPINDARPVIDSVKELSRIVRPKLGVRYVMITPEDAREHNLARSDGALIINSKSGESGILPNSPAEEAGLEVGDIIFEINAIKINAENPMVEVMRNYKPGDRIGLKIQRGGKVLIKIVVLGEF